MGARGGLAPLGAWIAVRGSFDGFTPAVWGVVLLKALNGILIPATFKYADNILYTYAKPGSIVLMTLFGAVASGARPRQIVVAHADAGAVVGEVQRELLHH